MLLYYTILYYYSSILLCLITHSAIFFMKAFKNKYIFQIFLRHLSSRYPRVLRHLGWEPLSYGNEFLANDTARNQQRNGILPSKPD
jgi:hypothetical protein